jgi:hypothetical protein
MSYEIWDMSYEIWDMGYELRDNFSAVGIPANKGEKHFISYLISHNS